MTINPDGLPDDTLIQLEVRLQIGFQAYNPGDAVSRYMAEIAQRGFGDFTYRVRNPDTEETWIWQQGQVYTSADYLALMADAEADTGVDTEAEPG